MAGKLFREKSLEKISSPEQLNDYMKVVNPEVWLLLAAMLLLLIGACVWGIFGRLETTVETAAACRSGVLTLYIPEDALASSTEEMTLRVEGEICAVKLLSDRPQPLPEDADAYALHLGGLTAGEWVYLAAAETNLPDGVYQAVLVTERTAPVSFVMN